MDHQKHAATKPLIERLRGSWTQKGFKLRPGVSGQQIESFGSRYQVALPEDLREYFVTIDGMEEGEVDNDWFSFLPLHAVKNVPEELAQFAGIPDYSEIMLTLAEPGQWFVIVDYLISSAVYAIRLSLADEENPVLWIGSGTEHRVVAPSFTGFVQEYLANPAKLF